MRRVGVAQCEAPKPVARRPERSEGHAQKIKNQEITDFQVNANAQSIISCKHKKSRVYKHILINKGRNQ